jgi:hypothetical protein
MATGSDQLQSITPDSARATVGLVANGSSGSWDVAVDQTVTGDEQWFLQVEGPQFYVYFTIPGPQTIERVLWFLESDQAPPELEIGRFEGIPVRFIRDDESSGRLFVLIGGEGDSRTRLTLSADEARDFANALRQVREDLADGAA